MMLLAAMLAAAVQVPVSPERCVAVAAAMTDLRSAAKNVVELSDGFQAIGPAAMSRQLAKRTAKTESEAFQDELRIFDAMSRDMHSQAAGYEATATALRRAFKEECVGRAP